MDIQTVTVVGGGTMGNGIAHVCALSGHEVRITDVSQDALDRALATISKNLDRQVKKEIVDGAARDEALQRIRPTMDLDAATAGSQLIIEAVPEKAEIKHDLFRRLDGIAPADAILANTCLNIMEILHRDLGDDRYRPCPLLRKYVAAGWLGRKAGRGFHTYAD